MYSDSQKSIDKYSSQSAEAFRKTLISSGVAVQERVGETLFPPNGIYVSPETKNAYYEYSNGQADGLRYEQFVTGFYQDLALTTEYFAAVFVVELPRPTAPLYINSRTTLTLNSILQLPSVPVLKGIEKVHLEGNFSEFFTVYSRDQHALDAFTTIVPNLMIDLLEKGGRYDIEFADRYVYFYRLYGPMSSGTRDGVETKSISFSSQDYLDMREFGINYGAKFARAARPSTGDSPADTTPLWQLVNQHQLANNWRQFIWLVGILTYMALFVFVWFIVIPLSIMLVGIRLLQWHVRKKRLLAKWAR